MEAWQQILLGIVGAGINMWIGYMIGRSKGDNVLLTKIEELEDELVTFQNPPIVEPQRFRIRTAESDPSRHSRVTNARLRAKRYPKPEPRK